MKHNMAKTELLIFPPEPSPLTPFSITLDNTTIFPVVQAINLLAFALTQAFSFDPYSRGAEMGGGVGASASAVEILKG